MDAVPAIFISLVEFLGVYLAKSTNKPQASANLNGSCCCLNRGDSTSLKFNSDKSDRSINSVELTSTSEYLPDK